ncbi:DUF2252 domain-containing protein [Couchioplanes caeruleus]|uniref:DUF2252 domain-containing protein n=2 Tax=Couchioplanes caeruleus TaxID=56438 RepID=A0A1K0FA67_9ACTN|nr:DUF2252 domain-containing protein [Couchioplanes caeruleus]OJF09735.1 hypothetical protein BG844_35975 [Couchioplanes caeruleus subsp. caeruleus]ROP28739.1 uncharacterized protein (DUF2252 family) [Couchioplanes caeruleus]
MTERTAVATAAADYPTPDARMAAGRSARLRTTIDSHAALPHDEDGPDPVELLTAQDATRVPELVPIRYGRMLASPFAFFRGAAVVMSADLSRTPVSGLRCQLCGDAHLSNFGLFASAERRLVFDINDFDETHPGFWEWDVKRLAASVVVAARDNGFRRKVRAAVVRETVGRYRQAMHRFASQRELDVWYARADLEEVTALLRNQLSKAGRKRIAAAQAKARTRDSMQAFRKLTTLVDGHRRIVADPPLIVPLTDLLPDTDRADLETQMRDLLAGYAETLAGDRRHLFRAFRFVDMARKVVGVGSVGTRCWIVLLSGRDQDDPLLLQVKEAMPSVLAPHVEPCPPAAWRSEGERVVSGQRLMQATGDIFLGWQTFAGIDGRTRDFSVRQLRDWKGSALIATMDPEAMRTYGAVCGWTLARAHARTGDRIAMSAYLGDGDAFDQALVEFAEAYADRNESAYQRLVAAARTGRISAREGV